MFGRKYYKLKKQNGLNFYIRPKAIAPLKEELETFVLEEPFLNTKQFAKKALFPGEIKTNNQVEGYTDDINVIEKAIKEAETIQNESRRKRIINLYNAYNYIMSHDQIDKNSLRELYAITSNGLLERCDRENMGKFYRNAPVYILKSGRLDILPDEGMPAAKIDKFMDAYFEFLNTEPAETKTDEYIKSQILHFYFVYIHPYFDVNGRTSRTLAMWYLLNKKAYSYVIFNRGISFKGSIYDKKIIEAKEKGDLTYFVKFMLDTVKSELEKEYIIRLASENAGCELTTTDYQSLLYFLSMRGLRSILDFATMYNRNNNHKSVDEIYREMIEPLLDKGILDTAGETKKSVGEVRNKVLVLRPFEYDKTRVKNLQL